MQQPRTYFFFFFFNDTATTEIYTLSLHDALPISLPDIFRTRTLLFRLPRLPDGTKSKRLWLVLLSIHIALQRSASGSKRDRKSTRLNSSHGYISYAVFCLKKKKNKLTNYSEFIM